MATMLEAALSYAQKGIPVFPCGDDKRPLTAHGFKDATINSAVIKKRWERWPNALIAMPTGPVSGVAVMDLDKKDGKNGFKAVPDWRKRSNVISRTMSKGAHLFFRDDGIPSTTSKIADGVDTRGKGGYVILPPSKGYKWINGHDFDKLGDWPDDLRPPTHSRPSGSKRIKNKQPAEKTEVFKALEVIPADDYQTWFEIGCALYHEFGDDGFDLFDQWSKKSDKYSAGKVEAKWAECEKVSGYTIGTIFHYADAADPKWRGDEIPEGAVLEDFVANMPMHNYIYLPTNQGWPAASVNARLGKQLLNGKRVLASMWLDKIRGVQSTTWSPGDPRLISDRVMRSEGGWMQKKGDTTLNLYTPPDIRLGDAQKAKPWVDLVHKLYPNEAEHIINFFAQRRQQPGIKINHALIFGGEPGIGKDTIIEGVKPAVGSWNFSDASPRDIMSRFNAHIKSVILRINEAHDLGDINRYAFYDSTKQLTASPPLTLDCEEKHMKKYAVVNVTAVVYTTNHRIGGIYLPENDRRHMFVWSELTKKDFSKKFWNDIYKWYRSGGYEHVAAYLQERDISTFDCKAAPPETEAWRDAVESNLAPENMDFSLTIDLLGEFKGDKSVRPAALSMSMIKLAANANFRNWLTDRKNNRVIPHRLNECGYSSIRNPDTKYNSWKYRDHTGQLREEHIYALKNLPVFRQVTAARVLVEDCKQKDPKWLKVLKKNKP